MRIDVSSQEEICDSARGKSGDKSAFKIGHIKFSCLQCCLNIKVFTAFLCLLACINGSIAASYLPAVITTIEERFELGSTVSGLIVSSYEIGATIAVIFVSYLGHQRHTPLILGWGTAMIAIGSALFSLPHYIMAPYSKSILVKISPSPVHDNTAAAQSEFCAAANLSNANGVDVCGNESAGSSVGLHISIFILAQTLISVGSTPILTIGLTYIDSHVGKKTSAHYIGQ